MNKQLEDTLYPKNGKTDRTIAYFCIVLAVLDYGEFNGYSDIGSWSSRVNENAWFLARSVLRSRQTPTFPVTSCPALIRRADSTSVMAANEIHDCKEAQYQSPAQFLRHPLKHTTAVHSRRLNIILSVCRVITQKGKKLGLPNLVHTVISRYPLRDDGFGSKKSKIKVTWHFTWKIQRSTLR